MRPPSDACKASPPDLREDNQRLQTRLAQVQQSLASCEIVRTESRVRMEAARGAIDDKRQTDITACPVRWPSTASLTRPDRPITTA